LIQNSSLLDINRRLFTTPILFILVFFLFSFSSLYAQTLEDGKFGKGLINFTSKDSTFSVKFAPRIQFRANTKWNYEDETFQPADFHFSIRRARLKFDGFAFSPKLKYKIELGISNQDQGTFQEYTDESPGILLDAVIKWNFYKNFTLWAGQTKLPGNIERVISSGDLQLINRSLLNSNFNIDRDIGFQLRHQATIGTNFVIKDVISISQGEGRNIDTGNEGGLQYTGRLELYPFGNFTKNGAYFEGDLEREQTPKLLVAATYNFNADAVKTKSNIGDFMQTSTGLFKTDITTIFTDVAFKYKGFSVLMEYAYRDAENPIATEDNGDPAIGEDGNPTGHIVNVGEGFNAQGAYLFHSNYELTLRFTSINFKPIAGRKDQNEYTIGVSKYIVGHKLKVQSDFSYATQAEDTNYLFFRLGFDLHF